MGVAGFAGLGAAVGYNQIATTTTAYLQRTNVAVGGAVNVSAQSQATVVGATLGVGVATGGVGLAGAGSATVNQITDTIDAHISGGSDVRAAGPIGLSATDGSSIIGIAGGVAGARHRGHRCRGRL